MKGHLDPQDTYNQLGVYTFLLQSWEEELQIGFLGDPLNKGDVSLHLWTFSWTLRKAGCVPIPSYTSTKIP